MILLNRTIVCRGPSPSSNLRWSIPLDHRFSPHKKSGRIDQRPRFHHPDLDPGFPCTHDLMIIMTLSYSRWWKTNWEYTGIQQVVPTWSTVRLCSTIWRTNEKLGTGSRDPLDQVYDYHTVHFNSHSLTYGIVSQFTPCCRLYFSCK